MSRDESRGVTVHNSISPSGTEHVIPLNGPCADLRYKTRRGNGQSARKPPKRQTTGKLAHPPTTTCRTQRPLPRRKRPSSPPGTPGLKPRESERKRRSCGRKRRQRDWRSWKRWRRRRKRRRRRSGKRGRRRPRKKRRKRRRKKRRKRRRKRSWKPCG